VLYLKEFMPMPNIFTKIQGVCRAEDKFGPPLFWRHDQVLSVNMYMHTLYTYKYVFMKAVRIYSITSDKKISVYTDSSVNKSAGIECQAPKKALVLILVKQAEGGTWFCIHKITIEIRVLTSQVSYSKLNLPYF
jgi:hypothetical protein